MLVLLNHISKSTTLPTRSASTTMAPNPLCLVWREQIIDNLRLISGRSAVIDIYTSRQPNKSYTIYAVKVHRGKRQEILSATGRDLEDAFENLHSKSSQEVYQFIEANGFAFPRGVRSEDSESSGSEASTIDASDVLSLSAGSDSDNDDIMSRRGKKTKSSRRKSKRKSRKHTKDDSSSSSSEEDVDSEPEQTTRMRRPAPGQRPSYIPAPPMAAISQPPPSPPGWTGHRPRTFPRAPDGVPPPPPRGSFPPGMRLPSPPQGMVPAAMTAAVVPAIPTAPSKPVRLIINWRGHGEKKIVENCQPSHRALQRTALAHVRSQWQTFDNALAQEMTPGRLWGLGAKVRKVALGKDMYSISAAGGDDLGMYFKAEDIPMFEVEVDHDGSIMPPPPPPQHHHGQR